MDPPPLLQLSQNCLLVIPCSGAKREGSMPVHGPSILSEVDSAPAARLSKARSELRTKAKVDETTLMPAFLRYAGQLYQHSTESISVALAARRHIVVVSGGYGLLLADEPIGTYERRFVLSDWPKGLLQDCLLNYACRSGIRFVIAVMSSTTDYARLIKSVGWSGAGLTATLVSPVSFCGGAMVTVPRAEGQAVAELIKDGLKEPWRSSDGLSLKISTLGGATYL
jgi:hypothetical protein